MEQLKALRQAVRSLFVRGVLSSVDDAAGRQIVQVEMLDGETKDGVEHMQRYGMTTHPPTGGEAAILFVSGNRDHGVVIAVEDRRFRLTGLEAGEVAIYDDLGQTVHLTRTGIVVEAPNGLQINGDVTVAGDVIADGISLKSHVHGQTQPGSGTTGLPNG